MSQLGGYIGVPRDALAYLNASDVGPDVFRRSNMPRTGLTDSGGDAGSPALVSGVMTSVLLFLAAGDLVSTITAFSGAVAADTPTAEWVALYSPGGAPALLGQSTSVATAWPAFTAKSFLLATPYRAPATGLYTVGINVTATNAVPSLLGSLTAPPITALAERRLAQRSGASLTTTAPATVASPAVTAFAPLLVAS
jgi:hypothetical protein